MGLNDHQEKLDQAWAWVADEDASDDQFLAAWEYLRSEKVPGPQLFAALSTVQVRKRFRQGLDTRPPTMRR